MHTSDFGSYGLALSTTGTSINLHHKVKVRQDSTIAFTYYIISAISVTTVSQIVLKSKIVS